MGREERRRFAKSINTPQKLEQYENDIRNYYKEEYRKKYNEKVDKFIRDYTVLLGFVLDHELEKEEIIKLPGRKTKDMGKKIGSAVVKITDSIIEHMQDLKAGYININDIEQYFKEEREVEWEW